MKKTNTGSFRLMSKKESDELWKKVDDPNNPYFQDYSDYYHNVVPKLHRGRNK